ncbi:putative fatty acyl-CoA reductase CG5065 isoform X2 [Eurytemora carolleeae]|uniref:putative fatty acyl-CoA reductase CG5065 isoform X2 n=1 Tax=Eurytemora carolleeae TaxID=1294199 RepID=UPI000C77B21D|nr:putative fatty acyl-CoA reductase CG5065 isoform X2 [Eurytemora carolleeae]|eukprot:XP_023335240.1 putative fatty acyl-CoA reductase CG5065 isoform X2 [Eurytemora affinis]
MSESPIKEFYKNKTIFVTGGTGFIGKVLIEKLLRSTEVSQIYVLTRPKKGETPQQRIKKLVESGLFDTLREISPNSLERVHAIQGDVEEVGLGIQDTDLDILYHEVDIVIHSAATVRFDENLSKALRINVNGVSEILTICKQMKKLEAMTIESLSLLGSDVTDDPVFTKSIIGARPNTYTYTKVLKSFIGFVL